MKSLKEILVFLFRPFLTWDRGEISRLLACIIIAAVFWFFNSISKNYDTTLTFPINYTFSKEEIAPINNPLKRINLHVRGYGWYLFKHSFGISLRSINVEITKPINTVYFGDKLKNLLSDKVKNMVVISSLDTLKLQFDKVKTKNIRILLGKVSTKDSFKIDYKSVVIEPRTVSVSGPKSILDTIKSKFVIKIEPIVSNEQFSEKFPIEVSDKPYVKLSENRVKVSFNLTKK